jgi:hypothetical protein
MNKSTQQIAADIKNYVSLHSYNQSVVVKNDGTIDIDGPVPNGFESKQAVIDYFSVKSFKNPA